VRRLAEQFEPVMAATAGLAADFQISDLRCQISDLDLKSVILRCRPSHTVNSAITASHPVAYFARSMAFTIRTSLSGGLGVLAEIISSSASDLSLPLSRCLLPLRYFRQRPARRLAGRVFMEENRPSRLPLHHIKTDDGARFLVEVLIRDFRACVLRSGELIWSHTLYLLDTNISANEETDPWVTGHLYGGDRETRIFRKCLLGIEASGLLRKLTSNRVFT